jgi:hypothetical protein
MTVAPGTLIPGTAIPHQNQEGPQKRGRPHDLHDDGGPGGGPPANDMCVGHGLRFWFASGVLARIGGEGLGFGFGAGRMEADDRCGLVLVFGWFGRIDGTDSWVLVQRNCGGVGSTGRGFVFAPPAMIWRVRV